MNLLKFHFTIAIIFMLIVFSACNSNRIYHETYTFDDYNWIKTDTISHIVDISEEQANQKYEFEFNIRYISGFPYKFLNLNILIICPDGKQFEKTESIQIRKDNSEYIGDGAGSYWDIDYKVKDKFEFEHKGKYIIKIAPIVDKDRVYFINELGIEIKSN